MAVTCVTAFDQNITGTYFAGQLVSGTVTLTTDKPKEVKGVLLEISGYATTRWHERHFNQRRQFFGREDYIASRTYLLGSEESQKCTLQPGTYTYSFACQLPYNCPSSFEGIYGNIRYLVKVIFVRPWKFDQSFTRGFTVLKMMDLNYDTPQLRIPADSQSYKIFCCGPCKTEPLRLELNVPQTGYVPGQVIPVNVLVINNTNIQVKELKFYLVMLVRYFSKHPTTRSRVSRVIISKQTGDSVLRNCTRSITNALPVPATPPTCLNQCSIIQICYQVEVEAKMKGMTTNHVITMPVVIGTVPFCSAPVQQQPRSSGVAGQANFAASTSRNVKGEIPEEEESTEKGQMERELPVVQPVTASMSDTYANIPPPSYEESVYTVRSNINDGDDHPSAPYEFSPLYPVYNIQSTLAEIPALQQNNGVVNPTFNE